MKKKYPSERAAELFNKAIASLKRTEDAPNSPIAKFHNAKERRELRRNVLQLRRGQIPPQFAGLQKPDEFAEILLLTIERDQTVDESTRDFKSTERELDQIAREQGDACGETFKMMYDEAMEGAMLNGPASEDAQRVRLMHLIAALGQKMGTPMRRQDGSRRVYLTRRFKSDKAFLRRFFPADESKTADEPQGSDEPQMSNDPQRSDEPIVASPADGEPARVMFRIGMGDQSWVGRFEKGDTEYNSVQLLPDGKHIIVCVGGAGYLIDFESRTLLERIGNDITAISDPYMGVVFVNHGERSVEAFGTEGRLWKRDAIGATVVGEARQASDAEEWRRFSRGLARWEVS